MKNSLLKSLLAVALNFVLISVLHAKTENVIAPSNTRQPQPTTQHYVLRLAHNPAPEDLDGEATDDGYSSDDDDYSSDEEDVFSDEDPEDPKTSTLHLVLRLRGEQPAKTSPLLSEEKMIGEADEVLLSATRAVSLLAQEEAKYSAHPTAARAVQRKEQETQTDDDLFNLVAPRATVINTTPLPNPINGQPLFEDSERDEDAFKASDSALRSLDENSSTDNEEYEDARSAVSAPSPVVPADEAIVIFPEEEITAALALSLEDATNLDQAIVEEPALVLVQEDAPVAIITETRFVLREDEPAPIVVAQPKQSTTRRSPALHTESPKIVQPSALPADIIARAQRLHDELRTSMPSTNEKRPAQLIDEALCGLLQNKLLKGEIPKFAAVTYALEQQQRLMKKYEARLIENKTYFGNLKAIALSYDLIQQIIDVATAALETTKPTPREQAQLNQLKEFMAPYTNELATFVETVSVVTKCICAGKTPNLLGFSASIKAKINSFCAEHGIGYTRTIVGNKKR